MKHLTLVRHAKSSWNHPELEDFHRPLNKRGRRNAPDMGERLGKREARPDRVLLSPAVRARETAELMLPPLKLAQEGVLLEESIYEASCHTLLGLIRSQPDGIEHLMLIGHNPGLTELWNLLGNEPVDNIPTCGVFSLTFADLGAWRKLQPHAGETAFIDYPKKHSKD